jgi:hypothetical protein
VKFLGKDQAIGAAILVLSLAVGLFYIVTLFYPTWLSIFGIYGAEAVQFWAIAIPVFIGFTGILIIGAWIGWTMATTPPPKPFSKPPVKGAVNSSSYLRSWAFLLGDLI